MATKNLSENIKFVCIIFMPAQILRYAQNDMEENFKKEIKQCNIMFIFLQILQIQFCM